MLELNDARWLELEAGYRTPVDLRPLLSRLESGEPAWDDLWAELHHQGDVGVGSFAAVPHLVRIHRLRGVVEWNTYALVATIELVRGENGNPDVPPWLREGYDHALRDLGRLGLEELPRAAEPTAIRSILALLAIVYGARVYARVLLEFSAEEVAELAQQAFGPTNDAG